MLAFHPLIPAPTYCVGGDRNQNSNRRHSAVFDTGEGLNSLVFSLGRSADDLLCLETCTWLDWLLLKGEKNSWAVFNLGFSWNEEQIPRKTFLLSIYVKCSPAANHGKHNMAINVLQDLAIQVPMQILEHMTALGSAPPTKCIISVFCKLVLNRQTKSIGVMLFSARHMIQPETSAKEGGPGKHESHYSRNYSMGGLQLNYKRSGPMSCFTTKELALGKRKCVRKSVQQMWNSC